MAHFTRRLVACASTTECGRRKSRSNTALRQLTFRQLGRRITTMRRIAITSILTIVVLATTASACVAGWGSKTVDPCTRPSARHGFAHGSPRIATARDHACGSALNSARVECSMRKFVPFHLVALKVIPASRTLQRARNMPRASDSVIFISSVGSPETDRGPPRS